MFRRISRLIVGLVLFGLAAALMVRAEVGVDPWTVFSQGLGNVTGLSIGVLTLLTSLAVLLLWIPLKQRPGVGTVLNILIIGPAIDLGLLWIQTPPELWQKILMFAGGLVLLAVASGMYIGSQFGPGPRDGLMTGLKSRLGIPIWIGRTSIEVAVLLIGWFLGGNVGLGTLAFALLIGPLCGYTLPLFDIARRKEPASAILSEAEATLEPDPKPGSVSQSKV